MAGRPKQPTKLKILKGTAQKCRMNPHEAEPDPAIPLPPEHLTPYALEEWGRMCEVLYVLGLVSEIDRAVLAGYCQAYGRWRKAEEDLAATNTLIIKTKDGNVIQNPLLGVANTALKLMHKCAVEFGMTPSARSKVTATPPQQAKSKWAK